MRYNITDNYVFFAYTSYEEVAKERSKIFIVRVKHDGSEAVKIKEIDCREIGNWTQDQMYIIDDKLIYFNRHYWEDEIDKMIRVMDFDGNDMNWEI